MCPITKCCFIMKPVPGARTASEVSGLAEAVPSVNFGVSRKKPWLPFLLHTHPPKPHPSPLHNPSLGPLHTRALSDHDSSPEETPRSDSQRSPWTG